MAIAPANGSVLVRVPGAAHAAALSSDASIPVGSIVDTRAGSVKLRAALPGRATQTGPSTRALRGAPARRRRRHGRSCCAGRRPPVLPGASAPRRSPASAAPRCLWGHVPRRFRTRASNSVITGRGRHLVCGRPLRRDLTRVEERQRPCATWAASDDRRCAGPAPARGMGRPMRRRCEPSRPARGGRVGALVAVGGGATEFTILLPGLEQARQRALRAPRRDAVSGYSSWPSTTRPSTTFSSSGRSRARHAQPSTPVL